MSSLYARRCSFAATALFVLLAASAVWAQPAELNGRWAGAIMQQGTPYLIEMEFDVPPDGGDFQTTLTFPYRAYVQFGFEFTYEPSDDGDGYLLSPLYGGMRLKIDLVEENLRGVVTREDSVVSTVFLQRVLDYDLPEIAFDEVRFPAGDATLAGTLVRPRGPGPHPTAVLISGRGIPGARAQMIEFWGTALARNGIAALTLDRRGSGDSTGDVESATSEVRFEDLRAALAFLGDSPVVDPDAIGVIGLGVGGWIGPMVAVERDDVAFMVALASTAENLADQQGHVNAGLMAASGRSFTEQEYQDAILFQKRTVELAAANAPWEAFEPLVEAAREASWAEFAVVPDSLNHPDLVYFRNNVAYDPEAALRELDIPFLVILAEDDDITPPVYSIDKYEEYQAHNEAFSLVILPRTEHNLGRNSGMVGEGEWPDRFYRHWMRPPSLYGNVLDWIRDLTGLDDASDSQ